MSDNGSALTVTLDLNYIIGHEYSQDRDGEAINGAPITVLEAIVSEAARLLIASATKQEWNQQLEREVQSVRAQAIADAVVPMVDKAVNSSLQRTNNYGDAIGPAVSLTEVIVDEAKKFLTVRAGEYDRNRNKTPMEAFIQEAVTSTFTKELNAEVAKAKAEVLATVRQHAASVIAETIGRMAKGDH